MRDKRHLGERGRVGRVYIQDGSGATVAQATMAYDEPAYPLLAYGPVTGWSDPGTSARGNLTTKSRWLDTAGAYVQTHTQYDQCGNVRFVWDARGNQSQVEYASTYAYPTVTTSDNAALNSSYSGNSVVVTDQTGKMRRTTVERPVVYGLRLRQRREHGSED